MSDFYKKREVIIVKALDVFEKNLYKSAVACAKEFDISSRLFQRRLLLGLANNLRCYLRYPLL